MRPNLINRLKEEWNNLDPVDPLRGLLSDAIDALAEQPAQQDPVAFYVYEWRNADGSGVFRSFRADESQFGRPPDLVIPVPPQRKPLTDGQQIAESLRVHGLTLVKTASGYEVLKLGQLTAHGIKEKNT